MGGAMAAEACGVQALRAWTAAGDFGGLKDGHACEEMVPGSRPWLEALPAPPELYWELLLGLYCVCVVKKTAAAMSLELHKERFVQSIVMACMAGYGGSLINPALLGVPAPPIANPKLVSAMVLAWILYHNMFFGAAWRRLVSTWVVEMLVDVGYEIFRCWVLFSWYAKAQLALAPTGADWLGPVICGTIGGSGGAFLPMSKGLRPLDDGAPWTMESAFYVVLIYHNFRDATPLFKANLHATLCLVLVLARLFPATTETIVRPARLLVRVTLGLGPRKIKVD
ncbi:Hypothetical Protein FCC1311_009622 [Hondaea fermentalgiana]|uniref:Uncharacterized protein n=1 Tax=Hondaea fermentalgiana TaxID=2315210 RepID=A0A2R5GAM3_9STRA|nr:Hypothetical Protein FCC1311_009622 [Hondaea fermentalgiana]|eukprot:GBG24744.1 Hypothetical Protein FCC1311_009622 [Hondaea fermentalgiana]